MKIKELTVYVEDLGKVKTFYKDLLNFPVLFEEKEKMGFKIGASILIFEKCHHEMPCYHFAINIPSNMEHRVLEWLQKKTIILTFQGDPIVDFVDWNAKAIYCFDHNGNILEFIARKNLNIKVEGDFEVGHMIGISEIGLACDDIPSIYDALSSRCDLKFYYGDFQGFCALGDEFGLFILVDKTKRFWFPSTQLAQPADFRLTMEQDGVKYTIKYSSKRLKIM